MSKMDWYRRKSTISEIAKFVYGPGFNLKKFAKERLPFDPLSHPVSGRRPFSVSFEGGSLGDEGKGSVVRRYIHELSKKGKKTITYRWNGGANAGHECILSDGSKITLHQIPVGILDEDVTAIAGRGLVFHPGDAVVELEEIKKRFGKVPARLLIDINITLCLDTHRVLETLFNTWYIDYAGSATGRGIAPAYADELLRKNLTFRDFLLPDWRRKFTYAYDVTTQHLQGFGFSLKDMRVLSGFKGETIPMGSRSEFIERLAFQREYLREYVFDISKFLKDEWYGGKSAFVFEGANGLGLHPRHGVFPDVTSSEIRARGIQDSTEGIVDHQQIAARMGIIKGTYMSSVGSRVMPGFLEAGEEVSIRNVFGEFGKTTGRPRGVLPLDMPAIFYWRNISDYEYIIITHMDINSEKFLIVADYKNENGEPVPYRPYQWYLNTLSADFLELPGWKSSDVKRAKKPEDLPANVLRYIAFLQLALKAKIGWITNGQREKDMISWFPS